MVKAVDKAIREAGLGLNPQTEGQTIRVPIPDLNEERRRELTRVAAKYAETARVSVRNVRRDGIETLRKQEKDGDISQDEQRKLEREIQQLTDDHIKRVDETLTQKDKEILQV
jgi:ribosome recycling factor